MLNYYHLIFLEYLVEANSEKLCRTWDNNSFGQTVIPTEDHPAFLPLPSKYQLPLPTTVAPKTCCPKISKPSRMAV